MPTVWFCLVAVMIAFYVILDGFDLGAGAISLLITRNERERILVLRSVGPVWDGNEVWLLAAGGTLYFAFPALYASAFSGFYLPLMVVLWLLILRGISIEFRNHVEAPIWMKFWDVGFWGASFLLCIFYGAALGNVVRGVPLDAQGYFFEPFWTNFRLGGATGILDWYTILVGLTALAALMLHGGLWVAFKTEGPVQTRARHVARFTWWGVAILTIGLTIVTFHAQPAVPANLVAHPWGYVFPVLALAGLMGTFWYGLRENDLRAFLASCLYLLGMLTSVVFGLYPMVLPASNDPAYSLTIYNARAGDYGLRVGLVWWILGMILVAAYFIYAYRNFSGKVSAQDEGY